MALIIEEPGLHSTVQDLGRPGFYNVGIPLGGAMDRMSHHIANLLVGNDPAAATIECTYTGPSFVVTSPTVMSVAGATVDVKVNDETVPQWAAIELRDGDSVSCQFATAGSRFYLAFRGGIDVPEALGSRGTYTLGGIGGFKGRQLAGGDQVEFNSGPILSTKRELPDRLRPRFSRSFNARIVRGLYDHLLTADSRQMLTSTEWKLTPLADRTGLRFNGTHPFEFNARKQPFGAGSDPSNIVDAGYAMGSIQIPGGGQPIILHRDAVSAGGYAMVGTVISADMDGVSQLTPGGTCTFEAVSIEAALAARVERNQLLASITEHLCDGDRSGRTA